MSIEHAIQRISEILAEMGQVTLALSGGVDSMTLAHLAHRTLGQNALMVHATSAAVPGDAARRVKLHGDNEGWNLRLVNSGELDNERYRQNPVNRCYFCKSCLYQTLTDLSFGTVVSGTNTDDLADYRPGLVAASENGVRHPYVEAGIDKDTIRAIADHLGLPELASLPASPCLASRVETGIPIRSDRLTFIDQAETIMRNQIIADSLRCRLKPDRIVLAVDNAALQTISSAQISLLLEQVGMLAQSCDMPMPVEIAPYQRGSAFIQEAV